MKILQKREKGQWQNKLVGATRQNLKFYREEFGGKWRLVIAPKKGTKRNPMKHAARRKNKASKKDLPSGRWIRAQIRRMGKRIQIKFHGRKK